MVDLVDKHGDLRSCQRLGLSQIEIIGVLVGLE